MSKLKTSLSFILDLLTTTFPTLMPKLAVVFLKFKQSNPLYAAIVLSLLVAIETFLVSDVIVIENETVKVLIHLTLTIITALTGSKTYDFLPKDSSPEEDI